jgi:hypothetical protein
MMEIGTAPLCRLGSSRPSAFRQASFDVPVPNLIEQHKELAQAVLKTISEERGYRIDIRAVLRHVFLDFSGAPLFSSFFGRQMLLIGKPLAGATGAPFSFIASGPLLRLLSLYFLLPFAFGEDFRLDLFMARPIAGFDAL